MKVVLSIKDLKKWIRLVGRNGVLLFEFSKSGVVVKGETEDGSKIRSYIKDDIEMMESEAFFGLDSSQLNNLDDFMKALPKDDIDADELILKKDIIDFNFISKSGESYILTNDYSVCDKIKDVKKIEGSMLHINRRVLDTIKPIIDIIEESEINSAEYIKISNLSNKIRVEACSGINYGSISMSNHPKLNSLLFRDSNVLFMHYTHFKDLYRVRTSFNLKDFGLGLSEKSRMLVLFDRDNAIYLPLSIPEIDLNFRSILTNMENNMKFNLEQEGLEKTSELIEGFNRKDTKAIMFSENDKILLSKIEKDNTEEPVYLTNGSIQAKHLVRTKTISSLLDIMKKTDIPNFKGLIAEENSLMYFYGVRHSETDFGKREVEVDYIIKGLNIDKIEE